LSALAWQAFIAAFLGSTVEFVEAFTIVLAVGMVRGWRPALAGTAAATIALAVLVIALGPHTADLDVPVFQLVVGALLILFGLRWLRKSILRSAGVIALHDEAKAFASESEALKNGAVGAGFDFGAAATAFNGVFIEGIEVVIIVLGFGAAGKHLPAAIMGASAAAALVLVAGIIARHPLTKVPENTLKMMVGVLISAFGTFWAGEGLGLPWAGKDLALIWLTAAYFAVVAVGIALAKRLAASPSPTPMPVEEVV
jgi:uncharacterized membrane protein